MKKKVITKTRAEVSSKISGKSAKRSDLVRKYLKEAKDSVETGYIRMCRFVNEAYKKDYFKDWKFDSFEAYCNKELNMEYRKAMYFVKIADKITELNIPDTRAEAIGWAKINQIIKVATPKNVDKWLGKAEKSSLADITESVSVSSRSDADAGKVPKITTMKFKMNEDTAGTITDALSEAKILLDTEDSVQALQMICMDWLEFKSKIPQRTSKKVMLDWIEKLYGEKKKAAQPTQKEEKAKEEKPKTDKKGTKDKKEDKKETKPEEEQSIDTLLGII